MDAIEALLTRRSVRHFTEQTVSEEQVQTVLRAAMFAPSACNQQPWQFLVITNRDLLCEIAAHHPFAKMLNHAPLAVIVCGDLTLEKCGGFWVEDCAAAMQNLLLAAHAQGLGSVWCGLYPNEDRVRDIVTQFKLPDTIKPFGLAAIGHPAEPLPAVERFKPERIHRNQY